MNEQTITVHFNDEEEFLDELGKWPPNISKVLRLTNSFEHSGKLPIQNVRVVATFMRHQWLSDTIAMLERVKLERYVGQCHDHCDDEVSKRVMEKAEEIQKKIENAAKSLRIEVMAGTYE